MRVFVGQRTASISTSQLDSDNIKQLAERAVAMAKLAPEDPYVRLAKAEELASNIPELDMFDAKDVDGTGNVAVAVPEALFESFTSKKSDLNISTQQESSGRVFNSGSALASLQNSA